MTKTVERPPAVRVRPVKAPSPAGTGGGAASPTTCARTASSSAG
ncbi:hypothetical protein ACFQV4_21620 [Streptomyces thermocarboxydus]